MANADEDFAEDGASDTSAEDVPEQVPTPKRKYSKRKQNTNMNAVTTSSEGTVETPLKKTKRRATGKKGDAPLSKDYNVDGVLSTWDATTDYGKSFRNMTEPEQQAEVLLLNKGAAKGLKGLIKNKLLCVHYKSLVADELKKHLVRSRVMPSDMFHSAPKSVNLVIADPNFISVGEWVEVDADRTPGYNSEGGIAVIISVHDALVDVK
jgi:hypothetical protein